MVKNPCNAGDLGSIPGLGRSPGGGPGTPPSILGVSSIPMGKGPWWDTVHGVTKSQTRLSDQAQHSTVKLCSEYSVSS